MKNIVKSILCGLLLLGATGASAQKFSDLRTLAQDEFRRLSEDVGAALSYHQQTPTEPLGITGFDVGAAITFSKVRNPDILRRAGNDSVPSWLPVPTLRANKGLPFGFDVGGLFAMVPGSDIRFWGLEARYAILEGGITTPALGVRGSFTRLTGISEIDMSTKGLDVSVSKGFLNLTPYGGIGRVWIDSEPHVLGLGQEKFAMNKVFVGAGFSLLLFNMNAELAQTGSSSSFSLKAGLRF